MKLAVNSDGADGSWIATGPIRESSDHNHDLHSKRAEMRDARDRKDMLPDIGELSLAQEDGLLPTLLASGSAPGESGLSILGARFEGGVHLSASLRSHLVCFQLSAQLPIDCRMAGRGLRHVAPEGSLAVCPAGIDCTADATGSVDAILVVIDPGWLALAAAEDSALEARLIERLSGRDQALLDLAHILMTESAGHYPNGPLFWNDLASGFLAGMVARHMSAPGTRVRGTLGKDVLARIRDYVDAHLDEPIAVDALASIAGRSPFHFTRVFTRSVGMTPHRYVIHLRLQRAIELVRNGRLGLAEIANRTGFSDQPHLSRWVRRVLGVSPTDIFV